MRTLKYFFLLVISMTVMTSCFEEPTDPVDLNDDGYNVVGFQDASKKLAAIADGSEYTFEIPIKVIGPTVMDLDSDITVGFVADEKSTAVEGTHYVIETPSLTLTASNNYLGTAVITMITEGIETPLDKSPVLYLLTDATGSDKVTGTGKPLVLEFNYACPSFLAGTYDVETIYTGYDGTVTTLNWTEDIVETGIGQYRTTHVGHWALGALDPGTPGFTFYDLCDVLTIPEQNLADYWANVVTGTEEGEVKADGTLVMKYSICYAGACRLYESTYTPVK